MKTAAQIEMPPWISIAILSMIALAYEILLMRLFSIIQWHHFAYMIISLALLGYGASGTFVAIFQRRLLSHYSIVYLLNIVFFSLSMLLCFLFSQKIAFNAEEIIWNPYQLFRLLAIYILLACPFFFVANAIGLTFLRFRQSIPRVYGADLLGAGLGSLLIIGLLFWLHPVDALKVLSGLALLVLVLAGWEIYRRRSVKFYRLLPLIILIVVSVFNLPESWLVLEVSSYKPLAQVLNISGSKITHQRHSPLGLISVVENEQIPFRYAPGLSLNSNHTIPQQRALFVDAGGMIAVSRDTEAPANFSYLDDMPWALPYHLGHMEQVLVLGSGGGSEIQQALYHDVDYIHAVELNKDIVRLLKNELKTFSGSIYEKNNVAVYFDDARGFVAADKNNYDLIQLALLDSFGASSAGLYALSENYGYTIEALQQYLSRLKSDGYLAISRWVKLPPQDALKLFATAIDALKTSGSLHPEQQLMLIRSMQVSTLLIKNTAFTEWEIKKLKTFCEQRSFDVAYYPAMPENMANRYNRLAEPYFYDGAMALLGDEREHFMQGYKFNLQPATDDKPFFNHFFKWQVFEEIISLTGKGGVPLIEWGYLILIVTLVQALLASIVIILLPLVVQRHKSKIEQGNRKLIFNSFGYFILLGLAFLFIEIAFIQKFMLFLYHPVYAVAVVLAAFLVFAGMGSLWSKRYVESGGHLAGVARAVLAIVMLGVMYMLFLSSIFSWLMGLPMELKILLSVLLIAPIAFSMGMPFPLGLARLGELNQRLVPWVWGVNGCASVLSAVLSTLLAIQFGFVTVMLIALGLYGLSLISARLWLN
ncbi:MAG: SAM-dependent methyltransferase [Gammaproteobacteria bacterium]|nr:SAM-dependent methyltransferase [Gammaproteobacteria bacterium]